MNETEQIIKEIEFLRHMLRELINIVSVIEDKIQILKRRKDKLNNKMEKEGKI